MTKSKKITEDTDYLFASRQGKKVSEGATRRIVRDVAKKAGIRGEDYKKLDPSKVRKVNGKTQKEGVEGGIPLRDIERIMGGKELETTLSYLNGPREKDTEEESEK